MSQVKSISASLFVFPACATTPCVMSFGFLQAFRLLGRLEVSSSSPVVVLSRRVSRVSGRRVAVGLVVFQSFGLLVFWVRSLCAIH